MIILETPTFPKKRDIESVEVVGDVLLGIKAAMESLYIDADKEMKMFGIEPAKTKEWYPLKPLVKLFNNYEERRRFLMLQNIGAYVAEHAIWPPINNFEESLELVNAAYHMNHRRDGKPLYDYENNKIIEGHIGHNYAVFDHQNRAATYVCASFYPSDFDFGMARFLARKFNPSIVIELDSSKPSRKDGADSCHYTITW